MVILAIWENHNMIIESKVSVQCVEVNIAIVIKQQSFNIPIIKEMIIKSV